MGTGILNVLGDSDRLKYVFVFGNVARSLIAQIVESKSQHLELLRQGLRVESIAKVMF